MPLFARTNIKEEKRRIHSKRMIENCDTTPRITHTMKMQKRTRGREGGMEEK